ncbi:MAG: Fe-S protein assembly co-chaperone HscB [Thermoanaerobaculia bacterium]
MTTTPPTLQACRECGAGAPLDAHFCSQCSKILPLSRQGDYFSFLGLPRKLNVDAADLEQRFRTLSRQFHPDFFYNAPPTQKRASLERSSYLNDAYRTLRQPLARIEYLLKLEGLAVSNAAEVSKQVPPALLEEVFALNEELDGIRELREGGASPEQWQARLERARQPIEAKRIEHEAQLVELAARWDAGGGETALKALRDQFLERNYIHNLLEGIERESNS